MIARLRDKERESITAMFSELNSKFPGCGFKMDHSLGFTSDSFDELKKAEITGNYFTIRYDSQGNVRIPVAKRTPIYEGIRVQTENGLVYRTDRSKETERGYCIIDELVVCSFNELIGGIITSPEFGLRKCSAVRLEEEISRLKLIYGAIPPENPVSVYFSKKVILI